MAEPSRPTGPALLCCTALLLAAGCPYDTDDDEKCVEIELEYDGNQRGELYVLGREYNSRDDVVDDDFAHYNDSDLGFEHLSPSYFSGSTACWGPSTYTERWEYRAWIDLDGSDTELCAADDFALRSPNCAPAANDPQGFREIVIEPGYNIVRISLSDSPL